MSGWRFYFGRTAGGRRLRDDPGGETALAAMAARRLVWETGAPCGDAGVPGHV
jgi:hypothetical protein